MKIKNPLFLPFGLALLVYLATANHYGWNALQALAAKTWQRSNPATQHK